MNPQSDDPNALFQQAAALHQAGRLDEARSLYRQLLPRFPLNPELLRLLGTAEFQLGNSQQAVELLGSSLQLAPDDYDANNNRGIALRALGRLDEALACIERAIALQPDIADAHYNRGIVLRNLGRLDPALAACDRAIALDPAYADAHYERGRVLQELRRHEAALPCFDKAIALQPDRADAHFARGLALQVLQRSAAAVESYDRALALKPDNAMAYFNRGIALKALRRYDEALESHEQALALNPDYAEAHNNRGVVLHDLHRLDQAMAAYDTAITLQPEYAEAYYNRANASRDALRLDAGRADYDRALALQPDLAHAYWNKALLELLAGDYATGWRLHEWRWKSVQKPTARGFRQPLWLGDQSPTGKTLLVHAEQGLGDTLQFCRYVPMVAALGARVILEVPAPLQRIMQTLQGPTQVIAAGSTLPDFDLHCPIMSLPLAFKTTLATIPVDIPYLGIDPAKLAHWRDRLGPRQGLRIGLVWQGGFRPERPDHWSVNERRNIALAKLAPLNLPNVEFHSLQKGAQAEAELAQLRASNWAGPNIIDFSAELRDFTDTAALIGNLDLVISVDTSVAHLAGALGKPVWLLNRHDTCWRWLLDRTDSPWYPNFTVFRQANFDDWSNVVADVRQRLVELTTAS